MTRRVGDQAAASKRATSYLRLGYWARPGKACPGGRGFESDGGELTGPITTTQAIAVGETWETELRGIALPGLSVQLVD